MIERSGETPAEHRSGEPVETKLLRIAARARKEPKLKFVNLYYLMNEEMLFECFKRLSADKAVGIDEVTKAEYAEDLEANLRSLIGRLHRMAYRPQPVRRVYIPKPGSTKQRPLGIPSLEDIASLALTRIRSRQFGPARDILDQVTTPALKPHAQVLRIHALGELNEIDRASAVYTDLKANPRPFSDELPDELCSRYIAREGSLHDDAWVYTREVDMFLLNV